MLGKNIVTSKKHFVRWQQPSRHLGSVCSEIYWFPHLFWYVWLWEIKNVYISDRYKNGNCPKCYQQKQEAQLLNEYYDLNIGIGSISVPYRGSTLMNSSLSIPGSQLLYIQEFLHISRTPRGILKEEKGRFLCLGYHGNSPETGSNRKHGSWVLAPSFLFFRLPLS